ncbi:MAG: hypothetical protein RIS85_2673, partial [Pseudomonadota bacterium]
RADMGRHFGQGFTDAELDHLMSREWAMTADDVLWRRSKLGLWFSAEEKAALKAAMGERET